MAKKQENNLISLSEDAFTEYMIAVLSRKIPSFLDWLNSVQRRILFMMDKVWKNHKAKASKVSTVAGDVVKIHPHWSTSVEWAIINLWWNHVLRTPLTDSVWTNFWALWIKPSSARYLECRLTKAADELLIQWTEEYNCKFVPAYSNEINEPMFLAAKIPFYLAMPWYWDIAVWYKSSRVTHNISDIINSFERYVENKNTRIKTLVDLLQWPDFATGWEIINSQEELIDIYESWKWSFSVRGSYEIEEDEDGIRIIVNSLPIQVTPDNFLYEVNNLIERKKITRIIWIEDQSGWEVEDENWNWKMLMRLVFDVKTKRHAKEVIDQFIAWTSFQTKQHIDMIWLDEDLKPSRLWLKWIYELFLWHRINVITKDLEYELGQKKRDLEIQEWYAKAMLDIDKVIVIIRNSEWREDAMKSLMKKFKMTELQASKVWWRTLFSLTKLDELEIDRKIEELNERIKEIKRILKKWHSAIEELILEELGSLKKNFSYKRLTKINSNIENRHVEVEEKSDIQNRTIVIWTSTTWFINYVDWVNIKSDDEDEMFKELDAMKIFWDGSKLEFMTVWKLLSDTIITSNGWWLFNIPSIELPWDKKWVPIQSLLKQFDFDEKITYIDNKANYWKKDNLRILFVWENWNWLILSNVEKNQIKTRTYKIAIRDTNHFARKIEDNAKWIMILNSDWKYVYLDIKSAPEKDNWWVWVKLMWLNEWTIVVDSEILYDKQKEMYLWDFTLKTRKINVILEKWLMNRWNKWVYLK